MKRVLEPLSFMFFLFAVLNVSIFAQQKPLTTTVASPSCNDEAALEMIQQQLAETKTLDDDLKGLVVFRVSSWIVPAFCFCLSQFQFRS